MEPGPRSRILASMVSLLPLALVMGGEATATTVLSLDGSDWHLTSADTKLDNATVPGGVWNNLHRAGLIGDPLYRDNDLKFKNMTTGLPGGWTFAKTFDAPFATASGSMMLLEFSSIQGLGNISLNGQALLTTDNMFRLYRVTLPAGLLRAQGNILTIHLTSVPAPVPNNGAAPSTVRHRNEADSWGWDWSPDLNPMAIDGPVKLVVAAAGTPYISSFSPKVSTTAVDPTSKLPTEFCVNASLVLLAAGQHSTSLTGTLKLTGDWGKSTTVPFTSEPFGNHNTTSIDLHAVLHAKVPDVKLWWPLHYGEPNLHTITVEITMHGASSPVVTVTKQIGFRSVALYTGSVPAAVPARIDPKHQAAFVGCFRDGNVYWGCHPGFSRTCQHALPHLAANDDNMTVSRCLNLCAKAGSHFTLAGLQDGTHCFCGTEIGKMCDKCMPLVGTPVDPSECGAPCSGDPSVACGGASYMWGSNSVYNISVAEKFSPATPWHSRLVEEVPAQGSGNSGFALVVNGVKVWSRGSNLVPFELVEAIVKKSYIRQTTQSVVDAGMNMLRVWGGGMYQVEAFYEECDRLGIMVYQDMMFCQRLYPHDQAFAANVKAELHYQVRRLRHHASIVLWDGSNENENDPAFYYSTMLSEVAANDDSRPLWPASPSSGFAEGVHTDTGLPNGKPLVGRFAGSKATLDTHQPYDYCTAEYVTSKQRNSSTFFKSEFGQVSLPAFETLAPALNSSQGDYGVFSPIMLHRKHAGKDLAKGLTSLFGIHNFSDTSEPAFKRMIFLSQLAQTLCVKTQFEEFRRGEHTFGGLTWQLNDVWQASSWGSLDYGGRWRALHHNMQAFLAPTMISVWMDDAMLRVYGSHHGSAEDLTSKVEVNITDIQTGEARLHHVVDGIGSKGTAVVQELLSFNMTSINPRREVVVTRLLSPANAASETVHPLLPSGSDFNSMLWTNVGSSEVTLTTESITKLSATVTVENLATAPLFYALVTSSFAGRFSSNLLLVPPKATRVLSFFFAEEADYLPSLEEFQKSLRIEWFNKITDFSELIV